MLLAQAGETLAVNELQYRLEERCVGLSLGRLGATRRTLDGLARAAPLAVQHRSLAHVPAARRAGQRAVMAGGLWSVDRRAEIDDTVEAACRYCGAKD